MKKLFSMLLFLVLINTEGICQYYLKAAGSPTIDEGLGIAATPSGESFVTGYFSGTAAFGSFNITSAGLADGFLCKLNSAGNYLWVSGFGGTGIDKGTAVATDDSGNVYVAGDFELTANILGNTFTSNGSYDIFIAKVNSAGTVQWVEHAGGNGFDHVAAISIDGAGNIAVTGTFKGQASFGSTILNSTINPPSGNPSFDIFIAKLNNSGVFQWAKKGSAIDDDNGYDICFGKWGEIYLYAQFSDTITFDVTHFNNISNAVCLVKFDSAGNELWFRKLVGTFTQPAGMTADASGNVAIAGNFTGTLNIFVTPLQTLTTPYSNRFYLLEFDSAGTLKWKSAKSSDGFLRCNDVVSGTDKNFYVTGNYGCRLNEFADVYGQGTFNSIGYSDVFVSAFDSSGSWTWARNYGGTKDDFAYCASIDSLNRLYFTGSFEYKFSAPMNCYMTNNILSYCGDLFYNKYCTILTSNAAGGNRDILTARCIDPSRAPYDFYLRGGTGCTRDVNSICVYDVFNGICADTILVCPLGYAVLGVKTGTVDTVAPRFIYQWSGGSPIAYPGSTHTVTVTSEDGCFSQMKQVVVVAKPAPADPLISDSKGVNINSASPSQINLCSPDSVVLTGSNISPGFIYYWVPPTGPHVFDSTITATQNGLYTFLVGGPTQCPGENSVVVHIGQVLSGFNIEIYNDGDLNDTVSSCENNIMAMAIDTTTNVCTLADVTWSINPAASQICCGFPCNSTASVVFNPDSTGWYTITAFSYINDSCQNDTIGPVSKQVYFIKLAIPTPPVLSISGTPFICPAVDTLTLTCSPALNYTWSGGNIISNTSMQSVQVNQPGIYNVYSTVTSSDGCSATGYASFTVAYKPNPVVGIFPLGGVICPNDSVQLFCTGNGHFQWIGPLGTLPADTFFIYASQPGNYYCILTDTEGCILISNTVVAQSYSTPTLLVYPSTLICNGTTATLQVIAPAGSIWQWEPPLSGGGQFQVVDSAGTYACDVLSCFVIITQLSATINSPVFPHALDLSGNDTICFGDSLLITAPAGYAYHWMPTQDTTPAIYATTGGYYFVQLTDSDGCYDFTDSVLVTIVNPPVTPLLSSNSPLCTGDSLILNSNPNGATNFNWSGPNGFASTFQNPVITNATVAAGGVYSMNALLGGCSSDTAFVTVTILPRPNSPLLSSNSPVCAGDSIFLNVNNPSLISYQWSGPAGFTSSLQNPVISNSTNADAGTYSVVGYDGSCFSDTAFIIIQVNSIPATPVISANNPLCEGDSLFLSGSSATATNYYWSGPSGFSSTQQNPVIGNIQMINSGIYMLVTANGNCFSDSVTYTITVTTLPSAPVATLNSPVCEGDTVLLNAIVASGAAITWSGPNGFSSTLQNPGIFNVQLQDSGWYAVTATLNQCSSLADSVLLTVIAIPPTPVITGNNLLCENDSIQLFAANPGLIYNWSGPSGFSSTQSQIIIYPTTAANSGIYTLSYSNGFCEGDTTTYTVTVNSLPPAPVCTANSPLCEGDTLILFASGPGSSNYQWTGPAGFTSGIQNSFIANITGANSGVYTVAAFNGCQGDPDSVSVTINQYPQLLSINSNSPVCEGDELHISFLANNFDNAFWLFGSEIFNNNDLVIPNALISDNGTYTLHLLNANCERTGSLSVEIKECTIEIPNVITPNDDGLNDFFTVENSSITNIFYKIFDRWGIEVYSGSGKILKWNGRYKGTGDLVTEGAYYYIFEITFTDKTRKNLTGHIEVLR